MIRWEHVAFCYEPGKPVLSDISLDISRGAHICLYGPSGRGKTTILRLIMGLEKPQSGRIQMEEGLRFAAVFQEDRLLNWRTVRDNLVLFTGEEKADALLLQMDMQEYASVLPTELSGGQRRRIALARALGHESDVLILDEPLTGLDEINEEKCLDLIHRYTKGRTLILVTHEMRQAKALNAEIVQL